MSERTNTGRCGHPHGIYDVTCARPDGHDGGHVGPFYVEPTITTTPAPTANGES